MLLGLGLVVGVCGLTERFGLRSDEEYLADDLAHLRKFAREAGDTATVVRPASANDGGVPILGFDAVRSEMDSLGFELAEVHRGVDRDLAESGVRCAYSLDQPREIIVGVFVRRT
jgi:hypothetical protein